MQHIRNKEGTVIEITAIKLSKLTSGIIIEYKHNKKIKSMLVANIDEFYKNNEVL
jgi:hypothetical protein